MINDPKLSTYDFFSDNVRNGINLASAALFLCWAMSFGRSSTPENEPEVGYRTLIGLDVTDIGLDVTDLERGPTDSNDNVPTSTRPSTGL